MSARQLITNGSVLRLLFGLSALFAPGLVGRASGVSDPDVNANYVMRLFGARDVMLGAATLALRDNPRDLSRILKFNMANEIGDSLALAQEVRGRGGFDAPTTVGLGFNLAGLATWFMARARLGRG